MADSNTDLIASDALNVTKFAGWGAAVAGVLSAVVAVIAKIQTNWPTPVLVALIGFAAVAIIVLGAVVITDMLVRRDLAKTVVPVKGDPALPLLYKVWAEIKPDLEKMAPEINKLAKDALVPQAPGGSLEDVVWKKFQEVEGKNGHNRVRETVEVESA